MSNPDSFSLGHWRGSRGDAALAEVNRSIAVQGGGLRRFAAFLGPGYLVAVGYMDPGNWATSIAGGSKFGYTLLVVALVSNLMAIVLQSLAARLAIASGRDLAQACRVAVGDPGDAELRISRIAQRRDGPRQHPAHHALAVHPVKQAQGKEAPGLGSGNGQQVAVVHQQPFAGNPASTLR